MHTQISAGISRMFLVLLIAVAAIVLVVWFKNQTPFAGEPAVKINKPAMVKPSIAQPAAIAPLITNVQELDAINIGDVTAEFQAIDADVNSL